MPFRRTDQFRAGPRQNSFNMTPVIDIVFLLIIFFVLACRFIEAENFPVTVPDGCKFAQDDQNATQAVTLTVMNKAEDEITFAVGSEEVAPQDAGSLPGVVARLAELIDARLQTLPPDGRIVTLRIDKDIPFSQAQYALAAVAQSAATNIRLAAFSAKSPSRDQRTEE
ncbi:MAG TPA: biopolymer transporter ExbD [Sedimentisphaerales bacterium]|nr:biopolymer transporter ExbD [Sedimentisphaerales bacterium]